MAVRALAMVLAVVVLAGCTSHSVTTGGDASPNPPPAPAAKALPYKLYTHCGIDWEIIAGRWFEARRPLSDGQGNPPGGWGNPYQAGTITMLSATQAEFRDSAGHTVILVLRPTATGPPHLCD